MLNKLRTAFVVTLVLASTVSAQKNAKPAEPAKAAVPIEATVAQPKPVVAASAEFKPLGFVGFAYAEGTYSLTCGGPKVGFSYGDFGMSAGFYPSFMYSNTYAAATPWRPNLGAGIEITYKKVAIIAPVYFVNNTYYYTIGLGYKF